jgi:hypothetical protein
MFIYADLEREIEIVESFCLFENEDPVQAFPIISMPQSPFYGYTTAGHAISSLLGWIWLKTLKGASLDELRTAARPMVSRALAIEGLVNSSFGKSEHDFRLICVCVLLGFDDLLDRAFDQIAKEPFDEGDRYFSLLNRVIMHRLRRNDTLAEQQYELFCAAKKVKGIPMPSNKLVEAFFKNDTRGTIKAVKKAIERMTAISEKIGAFEKVDDDIRVTFKKFQSGTYWLAAEAMFLRLIVKEPADLPVHEFWMPRNLFSGRAA